KSNAVEMRYIIDEFQRVVLAHPDIFFSLHHNNAEVFHLPPGNLRQRIVSVFGNNCNKKLVPVSEQTDVLRLNGYVGKPEFAKKTRGEQYFFVNNRYIKSGYLNHAIMSAYEELLPTDTFPLYVIFLDIDPARIDINVHPTKQEIKFDDERLVYNYLKVAVRHALGQYSITPTLDFEQEAAITKATPDFGKRSDAQAPSQFGNVAPKSTGKEKSPTSLQSSNLRNWQKLYDGLEEFDTDEGTAEVTVDSVTIESKWSESTPIDDRNNSFSRPQKHPYQIHGRYIVSQIKSGFLLIDQQAAHERILYERYLSALHNKQTATQKELFSKTVNLSPADAQVLQEMLPQMQVLGFDIQDFGQNSFVIHGVPADLSGGKNEQDLIEALVEQYKTNLELKLNTQESIARSMARGAAIKRGQSLNPTEMQELIDQLFACEVPYKSPNGQHCFITFELEELQKRFKG
ncbi:MAG: DNA mismatch repair endonuclease MutL, partial [Bacteroidota bacterium]